MSKSVHKSRFFRPLRSFVVPLLICLSSLISVSPAVFAGIHRAPIILVANKIRATTGYAVSQYRLFRKGANGEAVSIPFQIDEVNKIGDYVLNEGPKPNQSTADGIFDGLDELSFMGDDVGDVGQPKSWPENKAPDQIFELRLTAPGELGEVREGAVYIGIYGQHAPLLISQKYVIFDINSGEVRTSRYRYLFDRQNYLVVNGVDMLKNSQPSSEAERVPLIDSSTFYAKADLKYFVTVQVNHRSVNSRLEAYKTGPIRTIVRVMFFYSFLKLNFEVGMYTEVSFFSNSVILPAIIYNPLDGVKNLNKGSGFYYGFALHDPPTKFQFDTNMQPYSNLQGTSNLLDFIKQNRPALEREYWASLIGEDRMMYVSMRPSATMLSDGNVPFYYVADQSGEELKKRNNNLMKPLTESPVNLGLYFDLTKFREGEHLMSFQLFFENKKDYKSLETFKNLNRWMLRVTRM